MSSRINELTIITWRIPKIPVNKFETLTKIINHNIERIENLKPIFYLITCQRVVIATLENNKTEQIIKIITDQEPELIRWLEIKKNKEAFIHLSHIASSIDSLVLGEPQILGQTKRAMEEQIKKGTLFGELQLIIQNAIKASIKIFNTTDLPKGKVSLISLVEDKIIQFLNEQEKQENAIVAIVGTGKMGKSSKKLITRHVKNPIFYYITRRSDLIKEKPKEAILFSKYLKNPEKADIIVLANDKEEPYFNVEIAKKIAQKNKSKVLVLDLGVPRNSVEDVKRVENIELIQISDLIETINKNKKRKQKAIKEAQPIIEEQYEILQKKLILNKEKDKIINLRKDLQNIAENRKQQLLKQLGQNKDTTKLERTIELLLKDVIHVSQKHFEKILMEGGSC